MKIPKKLKIVGLNWRVEYDQEFCDENGLHGASSTKEQWIKLNPKNSPQMQEQTFLHEVMHAVWWSMGLRDHVPARSEEKVVNAMANGLYQTLSENGFLR